MKPSFAVFLATLAGVGAAETQDRVVLPVPRAAARLAFDGHSRWNLKEVFTSRTIGIECANEFKVYSGNNEDEITAIYNSGASSWCSGPLSWDAFFHSGVKHCDVTISPYGTTLVAIVPAADPFGKFHPADCTHQEHAETSLQLIGAGAVGTALFASAPLLAASIAFRISMGGVVSVLLFSIIVAFIFVRRFNRRSTAGSVAAALAALGASTTGILNFWFRFPDLQDLLASRAFLVYVAISFLFGMAFSYYFDSGDEKLIDILCAGLRIIGGFLVFYSLSQLWEVALAAIALLAVGTLVLLPRVRRRLAGRSLPKLVAGKLAASTPGTGDMLSLAASALRQHSPPQLCTPPSGPLPVVPEDGSGPSLPYDEVEAPASPPRAASLASFYHAPAISAPAASPLRTPESSDSPLLATGVVRNGSTGRLIKLNGATYKALVGRGYDLDRENAVMTPPKDDAGEAHTSSASAHRSASARRSMGGRRSAGAAGNQPAGSAATSPM